MQRSGGRCEGQCGGVRGGGDDTVGYRVQHGTGSRIEKDCEQVKKNHTAYIHHFKLKYKGCLVVILVVN